MYTGIPSQIIVVKVQSSSNSYGVNSKPLECPAWYRGPYGISLTSGEARDEGQFHGQSVMPTRWTPNKTSELQGPCEHAWLAALMRVATHHGWRVSTGTGLLPARPGLCPVHLFPLLVRVCVLWLSSTLTMSVMAFLSSVGPSSKLMNLTVVSGTPKLQLVSGLLLWEDEL